MRRMALGKNVLRLMQARGDSYEAVGHGCGCSAQTIHQLVKRDSQKSVYANKLAQYFKVSLTALMASDPIPLNGATHADQPAESKWPADVVAFAEMLRTLSPAMRKAAIASAEASLDNLAIKHHATRVRSRAGPHRFRRESTHQKAAARHKEKMMLNPGHGPPIPNPQAA